MIKFLLTSIAQVLLISIMLLALIIIDTAEFLVMWPFWLWNKVMREDG